MKINSRDDGEINMQGKNIEMWQLSNNNNSNRTYCDICCKVAVKNAEHIISLFKANKGKNVHQHPQTWGGKWYFNPIKQLWVKSPSVYEVKFHKIVVQSVFNIQDCLEEKRRDRLEWIFIWTHTNMNV